MFTKKARYYRMLKRKREARERAKIREHFPPNYFVRFFWVLVVLIIFAHHYGVVR